MPRWLLIIFGILVVGGFLQGWRFHPTAVPGYLPGFSFHEEVADHTVDLKNGSSFKGKLVEQSENSVILEIDGGRVEFSRDEIDKITKASDSEEFHMNLPPASSRRPLFTHDPKKDLLADMQGFFNGIIDDLSGESAFRAKLRN